MKVLIYIAHPAQYHFYKFIVKDLQRDSHSIKIIIKSKDILENLLMEDGVSFENILPENRQNSTSGMLLSMLKRDYRLFKIARKYKPDLFLGSDTCTAHNGWILRRPVFTFVEDDYSVVKKIAWAMMPFSSIIISPGVCKLGPFKYKKVPFSGYMKLAYLHPSVFTPNLEIFNFKLNFKYCIIRTVKLSAHHDNFIRGLNKDLINKLINYFEYKGITVFIDSENLLEKSLVKYKLQIMKNHFHHFLAFAEVVISDSQSLSVEAAMLGVPSLRFNDFVGKISVLEELEHSYGLTFGVCPDEPNKLFQILEELLNLKNMKEEFQLRRKRMLSEKINVKAFMVWFIENYPESRALVKQNEHLQFQIN
jgi:uncharacterized protein